MERISYIARAEGRFVVSGAPEGFDAYLAAESAKRAGATVLLVLADGSRAEAALKTIAFFAPDVPLFHFPAWDCLPYQRLCQENRHQD